MKTTLIAAALLLTAAWAPYLAAQPDGRASPPPQTTDIKRKDLMKQDLSVPGREVVQVLVEFAPGASFPRHAHPGEELVFVVEGVIEYQLDGKPPVTLKAGEVLFVPYGAIHTARNVGSTKAAELATYIVDKSKPLLVLSK